METLGIIGVLLGLFISICTIIGYMVKIHNALMAREMEEERRHSEAEQRITLLEKNMLSLQSQVSAYIDMTTDLQKSMAEILKNLTKTSARPKPRRKTSV